MTYPLIQSLKVVERAQLLPNARYPSVRVLLRSIAVIPQLLRNRYHPEMLMHA